MSLVDRDALAGVASEKIRAISSPTIEEKQAVRMRDVLASLVKALIELPESANESELRTLIVEVSTALHT